MPKRASPCDCDSAPCGRRPGTARLSEPLLHTRDKRRSALRSHHAAAETTRPAGSAPLPRALWPPDDPLLGLPKTTQVMGLEQLLGAMDQHPQVVARQPQLRADLVL